MGDHIKPTKSIRRLLKLPRTMETVPLEEITVLHAGELANAILANAEDVIKDVAPEFIGTVASDNPWETLHKIRNGQPGIPMPSLGVLDLKDQLDILAYTQTLPQK